ncbi:hypothetical protein CEXT_458561 [Caerostris extrusa]|uniref:Uncharacterized protein n=1 Tax=Caerostris extrusa TaxID=172846 RepID=A0AAV4P130_CAEEX|nr:hypothetical protein CEXT_458561 [Caerostris extrusa]
MHHEPFTMWDNANTHGGIRVLHIISPTPSQPTSFGDLARRDVVECRVLGCIDQGAFPIESSHSTKTSRKVGHSHLPTSTHPSRANDVEEARRRFPEVHIPSASLLPFRNAQKKSPSQPSSVLKIVFSRDGFSCFEGWEM